MRLRDVFDFGERWTVITKTTLADKNGRKIECQGDDPQKNQLDDKCEDSLVACVRSAGIIHSTLLARSSCFITGSGRESCTRVG